MTGPFRPCNRPTCRYCQQQLGRPVVDHESLPEILVGAAAIVLLFAVLFIVLPAL